MSTGNIKLRALQIFNEASSNYSASVTAQGAYLAKKSQNFPDLLEAFRLLP